MVVREISSKYLIQVLNFVLLLAWVAENDRELLSFLLLGCVTDFRKHIINVSTV